jgi:hypothetical protein
MAAAVERDQPITAASSTTDAPRAMRMLTAE